MVIQLIIQFAIYHVNLDYFTQTIGFDEIVAFNISLHPRSWNIICIPAGIPLSFLFLTFKAASIYFS